MEPEARTQAPAEGNRLGLPTSQPFPRETGGMTTVPTHRGQLRTEGEVHSKPRSTSSALARNASPTTQDFCFGSCRFPNAQNSTWLRQDV